MTTSTHKRKANKFLLVLVFLLTFFLVYWYGHPQLIQQKWDELEGEVRRLIKGQTVDEEFLENLRELRTAPSQSSNKIVY